jgi:hypothetical protein
MKFRLTILLSVFALSVLSQELKKQKESFIKDFSKIVEPFIQEEQKSFVKKELAAIIMDPAGFSDNLTVDMISTFEILKSKNVKPYPVIYNYVYSVCAFIKRKQSLSSFNAWQKIIEKMIESKNSSRLQDFLDVSATFFSEDILMENPTFNWYYRGGSYIFENPEKPMMIFEGGNLVCAVENTRQDKNENPNIDSAVVYNAKGIYDPFLKKWVGEGGMITWEKAGLPKSDTYAELTKFELSLKSSSLNCDTVTLKTPFFNKPIKGKLSERAFRVNREDDKIYPQFISFEKRLQIKRIKENVDYEGGFSLMGKNFVGIGIGGTPASLKVYRNGKEFIKVFSQYITVNNEKIHCNDSKTSVYIGLKDSIFHPNIEFTYELTTQMIDLKRGTQGMSQAPFSNSYHQVDMYVPMLEWKYDTPIIGLTYIQGMSQDQRYARLESKQYFDVRLYDKLQGLEKNHPLASIADYCYKNDMYILPEGKIATALGKTIEQAKTILLELATYGFINYDTENKIISITPKLMTFAKAKSGKTDYDNLKFESDFRPKKLTGYTDEQIKKEKYLQNIQEQYEQKNKYRSGLKNFGNLDLGKLEIALEAVDILTVSDVQRTFIFPRDSKVVLKENRNFDFSGWISTGKLEINALESNYIYDAHKINLFKTEKSLFRVNPMQEADGKEQIIVSNRMNDIVGDIIIDEPTNKSGLNKKFTDFPKLNVTNKSYIYYNDKSIFKGAYDSTRFYYTMDPFKLDSLDNFVEKSLRFSGELTSAGIFPKFRENLKIMPDYSLGFSTKASDEGYDFYGSKALYDNKIILTSHGLQGAGFINFIESSSISKGWTFLPDSTIGFADFENRPVDDGIEYPDIQGKDVYVTYVPKNQILKAKTSNNQEMTMFGKQCRIKGSIFIQPFGATGSGVTTFRDANLGAKRLKFKRWEINSDTANFNVKNNFIEDGEDPLSLKTENLQAHVSFKTRKGEFKSNSGSSRVEFPVNQYLCKIDFFTWFMDREELELSTNEDKTIDITTDLDLVGANFFSLHPDQDSLQFKSREAKFSVRHKTIECKKIEYLEIADARIYPDTNTIMIRRKAKMDVLENSKIVCNSITKFHRFTNTKTEITARRKYESVGDYPYYDLDSNLTIVKLKRIWVDSTFQTNAIGEISDKDNFKLSEKFNFYGKIKILSSNQFVNFTGATRVNHTCDKFKRSFMSFSADIDPKNIQIPISNNMKSLDSTQLAAGILWRDAKEIDDIKMYPTFLSELQDKNDQLVFTSNGFIQFNYQTKEFQIASKDKLINKAEKGNYLALNTSTCAMTGSGVVNLGLSIEPASIDAVGTMSYNPSSNQTSFNLTLKYNVPLESETMEKIAQKINTNYELKPLDLKATSFENAMLEWTDQKTADKIISDFTLLSEYKKIPEKAKAAIVISGLKITSFSDPRHDEKGIITNATEACVVSIFNQPVMKYIPMKAFFQQNHSSIGGDRFSIYFSVPGGYDYYFDYNKNKTEGDMKIFTSDGEFVKSVNELKSDKKKTKDFSYLVTTNRIYLVKFLKLFGIEE